MDNAAPNTVLVAENLVMYPHNGGSKGAMVIMNGIPQEPQGEKKIGVTLPSGKLVNGVELGFVKDRSIAFAKIEGAGADYKRIDEIENADPEVGDNVFIIARRAKEWKCAPFFLPAIVNGELEADGRTLFSLNLTQEQLSNEALGAIVVSATGKLLGIVNSVNGKDHAVIVAPFRDFKDAIATAANTPQQLDQEQVEGFPGMDPDFIPVPQPPIEENRPNAYLGVGVGAVTEEKAKELELPKVAGVFVERVGVNSPAEKAGIKVGDVILEAAGQVVNTPDDLRQVIAKRNAGDEIQFIVFREGKEIQLTVKLGDANRD